MGRGRVLLLIACVLGLGTVALVAPAGATPLLGSSPNRYVSPTHRQVCASAPAHFSSCLAQVVVPETNSGTNAGGGGASRGQTASPQNTSPTGLPPKAITTAYGFPTTGGAGKTIAIVDAYDDPTIASNLNTFSSQYGLPPCTTTNGCFTKVNQTGGTTYPRATSGWGLEISLDVEWAHALAPRPTSCLVEATSNSDTNLFVAVTYASQHAQYVSMSWGGTEFTGEATFDADFTAAPSVSFFAASGDSGRRVALPVGLPRRDLGRRHHAHSDKDDLRLEGRVGMGQGRRGLQRLRAGLGGAAGLPLLRPARGDMRWLPEAPPTWRSTATPARASRSTTPSSSAQGCERWLKVGGTSASAVLWAARSAVAGAHVTATYVYGDNIPFYDVATGEQRRVCPEGLQPLLRRGQLEPEPRLPRRDPLLRGVAADARGRPGVVGDDARPQRPGPGHRRPLGLRLHQLVGRWLLDLSDRPLRTDSVR